MSRRADIFALGIGIFFSTGVFTSVNAQDVSDLSFLENGLAVSLDGLEKVESFVSYTIQADEGRSQLSFDSLGQEVLELELNYRSEDFLEVVTEAFPPEDVEDNRAPKGLEAVASAVHDGGMQALAAEETIAFIQGAAKCAASGGELLPKDGDGNPRPRLVRSEMDLHFNVGAMPNGSNFGRGQFDVSSIKVLMCVVSSTPADSFPIIVDRRWVINVGDGALIARTQQRYPPDDADAPIYPFRLSAQGNDIQLVSYYVSGVRQPYTDPLYETSPNSCIDIFFTIVPVSDQPIMISRPGDLVFCAGGACGNRPPKLDATH
ncbi:hypothetical protein SAMN05444007_102481 [Cribrihabitans marinus]|uniref:Uncharacterized protein n=1 Tax=Cribrihabitans marinus TaxID=1227549 RepID=A0A1H6U042_9RHOB|nr:hypothetical protein [Cribrihabitans marinus]GGH21084.1 hypothetical protein GCM10010973_05440 [Cribrihabitans marinus]SEI85679.1 hypothetical protein SAMN05444007_102481 [Cribrihabitans marinus]